jgi:lysophospholipase L1-like esterase
MIKPRKASSQSSEQSPADKAAAPREKLKRIALKTATTIISTVLAVSPLLGVDLYLHHKHGVNLWGYRGPAVGQKRPGEKRIAVLGGSTTWGFGLSAGQAFPAQLQSRFAARPEGGPPINVLNLGFNNEGAYSFKYTLKDYEYLDYDEVVLYSGYNDLNGENQIVLRHGSPIFLWTGYFPLLPALTADKIRVWKNRLTNGSRPVVFTPPAKDSEVGEQSPGSLQKQLGSLTDSGRSETGLSQATCPLEWRVYCQEISDVTDLEIKRGKRVLVVTEPYISDKHVEQQRALEGMLSRRFAGQANFRYLNLGRAVDLRDHSLCWDGMHLTEEGNRRIAAALIQPVLEMLQRWSDKPGQVLHITSKRVTL